MRLRDERRMSDLIQVADDYYIRATSARVDDRVRVLKDGDTFVVFDRRGDIHPWGRTHHGLYHDGTRFLSWLELEVEGQRPLLLSSTIRDDNSVFGVDLANPDVMRDGTIALAANAVHIARSTFLHGAACYQELRVRSYAQVPVELRLTMRHGADFRDIFEVRGTARARRGTMLDPEVGRDFVVLRYQGLDDIVRSLRIESVPQPTRVEPDATTFVQKLAPQQEATLHMTFICSDGHAAAPCEPYPLALKKTERRLQEMQAGMAEIVTTNRGFNEWDNRSVADLLMMLTEKPEGFYPYAGVPWFSTMFGRDGIVTALECLAVQPAVARGVLSCLAVTQAVWDDAEMDAEPGKILHEARGGEMAGLREVPFGRYYGSVDATPLFVMLAGAYWRRTGDTEFLRRLWPHVQRALEWIDGPGNPAGDGFVSYHRRSTQGLVNQGWKDSGDSVFHADGTLAKGPIALCEVQGYVYAARLMASEVAAVLGLADRATQLREAAGRLRIAFDHAFWCEDLGTYALALDGDRRPCRVRSSNAGQCLYTGIVSADHSKRLIETLLGEDSWSGWGIRTLSSREVRFNPMSYHNGSVWPHDNALIASGCARYGSKSAALQILSGLYEASRHFDLHRMPELFCGFARRSREGPTLYPVACAPQSWAIAAPFLLMQACLGLAVDGVRREITVDYPVLPEWLDRVTVRNLRLPGGSAEITFLRHHGTDVGVQMSQSEGDVRVRILH